MKAVRSQWILAMLIVLAPVYFMGCGGGGGGGGRVSSGNGGVDVFVTDNFRDDFRQVLVTIYKVEGSTDGTTFQTLYDDANGQTINVAALADSAVLLARANVTNANFTQVRVTIGDHLTLVSPGGATSSVPIADGVGTATGDGKRVVTFNVTTNSSGNVIVDFDLASFQLAGGRVRPVLHGGDPAQFQGRRRDCRPVGTVANLVAGASFDLQGPRGSTIHVVLNDQTTITSASGSSGTLANGQHVFVEGTYDSTTRTITATSVRIDDRADQPQFQAAKGTVASVSGNSFTVTVDHAHHFTPTGGTITVTTDANTVFRRGRTTATLADATAGTTVLVGGAFDDATQTLTAKFVHLR